MKKFTFALMALLALTFSLKAQQYVSTAPANRNVILEEFTGRGCGYCTDGHRIANELMAANPNRLWAINIHAGGYAQTSYPNMITTDGNTIHGGFSISGYPTGVVNRTTSAGQSRSAWAGIANTQLNQASECNVAGIVVVNPATRVASITVEVYYTGNSAVDENYLTVAMLQDSILGSQTDYGNYNPTQWLNGQYVHMHILRDVVSSSAWGDPISPTTQGSLITMTYEYPIPESIGSPNGVEVDIENIFFLAWVSERFQGTPARPILTGCKLEKFIGSGEPIYPYIKNMAQSGFSCSHEQTLSVGVQNGGTETLTALTLQAEVEGETFTVDWEGTLEPYALTSVEIPVEVPFGTFPAQIEITSANNEPYSMTGSCSVTCAEWVDVEVEGAEEELTIHIMQDKFGNQTTWDVVDGNNNVIASGGPYSQLLGGSTPTQLNIEHVVVPANECIKFTIYDAIGNGINCGYGEGYYKIFDSHNNLLVDGDGAFGAEASHILSVFNPVSIEVATIDVRVLGYHEALFTGTLTGEADEVGFVYRKVTSSEQTTVEGVLDGSMFSATVDDLEIESIYMVRAYAVANGVTVYGEELTFNTWMEGVNDMAKSLRIYPNPTSSVLNIEANELKSLAVYNSLGQLMLSKEVQGNNVQISTDGMENGIYFLRLTSQSGEVLNHTFSVAR